MKSLLPLSAGYILHKLHNARHTPIDMPADGCANEQHKCRRYRHNPDAEIHHPPHILQQRIYRHYAENHPFPGRGMLNHRFRSVIHNPLVAIDCSITRHVKLCADLLPPVAGDDRAIAIHNKQSRVIHDPAAVHQLLNRLPIAKRNTGSDFSHKTPLRRTIDIPGERIINGVAVNHRRKRRRFRQLSGVLRYLELVINAE